MVLVHIGTIVGLSRERQFFRAPLALWQNLLAPWCHPPGLSRTASSRPNKQQFGKKWQKHAIYNQYVYIYIYTFQYILIFKSHQITMIQFARSTVAALVKAIESSNSLLGTKWLKTLNANGWGTTSLSTLWWKTAWNYRHLNWPSIVCRLCSTSKPW